MNQGLMIYQLFYIPILKIFAPLIISSEKSVPSPYPTNSISPP